MGEGGGGGEMKPMMHVVVMVVLLLEPEKRSPTQIADFTADYTGASDK